MNKPQSIKKKPGRPRKHIIIDNFEIKGVVEEPANEFNTVEFVYSNTVMFKKILSLFKQYEAFEITIQFENDTILFHSNDHEGKNNIFISLDCHNVNHYYCKENLHISVKQESLEKILRVLDKNNNKILIAIKDNCQTMININVKNNEYDIDNMFELEVNLVKDDLRELFDQIEHKQYNVNFTLNSRHFKKTISDIACISKTITIQKIGVEPLQFVADDIRKINYNSVYKNSEKIKLESNLKKDEIFSLLVDVENIKPFSNTLLGDEITLFANKTGEICLLALMDKKADIATATVRIYIQ